MTLRYRRTGGHCVHSSHAGSVDAPCQISQARQPDNILVALLESTGSGPLGIRQARPFATPRPCEDLTGPPFHCWCIHLCHSYARVPTCCHVSCPTLSKKISRQLLLAVCSTSYCPENDLQSIFLAFIAFSTSDWKFLRNGTTL